MAQSAATSDLAAATQRLPGPTILSTLGTVRVPYAIAAVQMKEGVSLLGRVVDIPLARLAIGLAVRFRPLVSSGGHTAVGFGPA